MVMQFRRHDSDSEDSFDELGDTMDDVEIDGDEEEISDDDSFDPDATDSDESMFEEDGSGEEADGGASAPAPADEKPSTSNGGVLRSATINADGEEEDVVELNSEDEDDPTVRAMIAAIRKERKSPPDIKLEEFVTNVCFHNEEDLIAVATIDGDVHLYEYKNEGNTLKKTLEVHSKAIRDMEFSLDARDLLSCSKDKSIMITDVQTEKLKNFYENAHNDAINTLHIIDEHVFATGCDDGIVKLWDRRQDKPILEHKAAEGQITQMLTNDEKKLLLLTSSDGYLTTLNLNRQRFVESEPYDEELNCMGLYRRDSKLVIGTSAGNLYTYKWDQFGYHTDKYPCIKSPISVMLPITDRIACVAGEEGVIRACHIAPNRNIGIIGQHSMPVESMDVNHNGELIASSSHNNDVRFWNVKYFEDLPDIKYNEKHRAREDKRRNLPSSKGTNNVDFFAGLA